MSMTVLLRDHNREVARPLPSLALTFSKGAKLPGKAICVSLLRCLKKGKWQLWWWDNLDKSPKGKAALDENHNVSGGGNSASPTQGIEGIP